MARVLLVCIIPATWFGMVVSDDFAVIMSLWDLADGRLGF